MNAICQSKSHCVTCLNSQSFRTAHGLPSPCTHGITADNIPKPQPTERDRALQAAAPAGLFTRLHRFIQRLGIAPQRCGCAARAERWDRALLRWLRRGVRPAGPMQGVRKLTST
jgi:hypothetical protein